MGSPSVEVTTRYIALVLQYPWCAIGKVTNHVSDPCFYIKSFTIMTKIALDSVTYFFSNNLSEVYTYVMLPL